MVTYKMFEIEKIYKEGKWTIKIRGALNRDTITEFNTTLYSHCKNLEPLVIDLSELSFIDSFGVANLVEKYQWSRIIEQDFRLKGLRPEIKKIFEMAGLKDFFGFEDT